MQRRLDEAAEASGGRPSDVHLVYDFTLGPGDRRGAGRGDGPPEHWVDTLFGFTRDLGFDTLVLWAS